jgi:signal transduction histidine kinase
VGNAIRHNIFGGKISIELTKHSLIIVNSGNVLSVSPEKLFERFLKASPSGDSAGLGLSIVKQICDTYNFTVNYTHVRGIHTVSLNF